VDSQHKFKWFSFVTRRDVKLKIIKVVQSQSKNKVGGKSGQDEIVKAQRESADPSLKSLYYTSGRVQNQTAAN